MRLIIWLLLSMTTIFPSIRSYSQKCDTIIWKGFHQLKWKNFKGKPDNKSAASALTAASLYFFFTEKNEAVDFKFIASFSTCHSWVKKDATKDLLKHEQTHFDIAEYHRRLMAKEMLSLGFSKKIDPNKLNPIAVRYNRLFKEMEDQYDKETNHSIIAKKQKSWSKKIKRKVKNLNEYHPIKYHIDFH